MWLNGQPRRDLPLPVWQRGPWRCGFRVHGYWLDDQRMGHVMLSSRRVRPAVYAWAIDATLGRPEVPEVSGEEQTLRAAKRRVEAVFRRLYSWRFPASRGY
jgi:hypothetical protein